MILINKDSVNTVVATLTEYATIASPYFTCKLQNQLSKELTYFVAPNISTATTRYDMFQITETGSTYVNLTAGTINLAVGSYNYTFYENDAQTLAVTGNSVESGVLRVIPTSADTYWLGTLDTLTGATSGMSKNFLGDI
jgi:hypothetical protein